MTDSYTGDSERICQECIDNWNEERKMTPDAWVPFILICPLGHMEYA